jgi:hypothetical protein
MKTPARLVLTAPTLMKTARALSLTAPALVLTAPASMKTVPWLVLTARPLVKTPTWSMKTARTLLLTPGGEDRVISADPRSLAVRCVFIAPAVLGRAPALKITSTSVYR